MLGETRKLPAALLPLPLGEVASPQAMTERAHAGTPPSVKAYGFDSSPKGTPFGYAAKFAATTKAVPLDRLSPAGERCRASDRVGSGWLDAQRQDGRGSGAPLGELAR